jgi:hypothetical protein
MLLLNEPENVTVYALFEDGMPVSVGDEKWTLEIAGDKWARLAEMKGISIYLEVTGKNHTHRIWKAHLLDAPGNSPFVTQSTFASQLCLGRRSNPTGKLRRAVLACKTTVLNFVGLSYKKHGGANPPN